MTINEIKTSITEAVQKVTGMAKWKKVLIITIIIILIEGAYGLSMYFVGTNTCEPQLPPIITEGKTKTVIIDKTKPALYCGESIEINQNFEAKDILFIEAHNKCMRSTKRIGLIYSIPTKKNELTFGVGPLFAYVNDYKKLYVPIGGSVGYTRFKGNFGIGGEVGYYQTTDNSLYVGELKIKIKYRW